MCVRVLAQARVLAPSPITPDVDVSQLVLNKPDETLTVQVGIVDVAPKTTMG